MKSLGEEAPSSRGWLGGQATCRGERIRQGKGAGGISSLSAKIEPTTSIFHKRRGKRLFVMYIIVLKGENSPYYMTIRLCKSKNNSDNDNIFL